MITHCLENNQLSQISIDEFDEDLLYELNTSLVGLFEALGFAYVTWQMRRFMDTIASGTRSSLFIPFVSSSHNKLENAGTDYMMKVYQKGGK
jgi:hypothetical protein